jgi:hypothetical protein
MHPQNLRTNPHPLNPRDGEFYLSTAIAYHDDRCGEQNDFWNRISRGLFRRTVAQVITNS